EVVALYDGVIGPKVTIRLVDGCIATSNLLVNPGAETGDLTGWSLEGISQPFIGSPTNTFGDKFSAHTGNFYFAGGTGNFGGLYQTVSLIGKGGLTPAIIDTGRLLVNIGFWEIGTNQVTTADWGRITVLCRDENTNITTILRFPQIDS